MAIQLANYQAVLTWDASDFKQGMANAEQSFNTFSGKMDSLGKGIVVGIGAAVAAAVAGIVAFGKESLQTGAEFDAAVSQIAATMGTTTDQIENLRLKAMELGESTSFSATQAAEGLNILAMSGLSAEEQLAAVETVLNLAAAGAIEMADAAAYTMGAVKGFGDEAANAQYYADLIAKGATLAATNVNDLGEALSSSAATAANYGQHADSVTLALLRLAEQNVTGSAAATALNRAMSDLYIPTDDAAKALKKLGVSAYDSSGQARDFNNVVDDLNGALAGMSDAERNAYLGSIFTTQGLKAFNMMTASSTERVEELAAGLEHASDGMGAAAEQAATMMDNLQGDITIFNSAVEGLMIAVSDNMSGLMRNVVQFGTEQIGILTKAVKEDGITGLASAVGEVMSNCIGKVNEFLPGLLNSGIEIVKSLVDGISSSSDSIASTAAQMVTTFASGVTTMLPNIISTGTETVISFVNAVAAELPTLIPVVVQGVIDCATAIASNLPALLGALAALVSGLVTGIQNSIPTIVGALPQVIDAVLSFITSQIGQMAQTGQQLFSSLVNNIGQATSNIVAAIPGVISSIVDTVLSHVGDLAATGYTLFNSLITHIGQVVSNVVMSAQSLVDSAITTVMAGVSSMVDAGYLMLNAVIQNASTVISNIAGTCASIVSSAVGAVKAGVGAMVDAGYQLLNGIATGVANAASSVISSVTGVVNNIVGSVKSFLKIASPSRVFAEIGGYMAQGIAVGFENEEDNVIDTSTKVTQGIVDNVSDILGEISDIEPDILSKGVSLSATKSIAVRAALDNKALESSLHIGSDGFTNSVSNVFDNFIDKNSELMNRLISAVNMNRNINGRGVIINMGNITVSGVLDRTAAEQVRAIADNQIDDVVTAIAPYFLV